MIISGKNMKATLKCNPERLPDRGLPTKDIHVKQELPDLPITVIPRVKPSKPKKPNKRTKAFVPERKDLWTPENDAELMRRYWAGESYDNIGKAIGRSAKAVKIRANAIRNEQGKRPRRVGKSMFWQESEDKILIEMFEAGNGYKDIAKKLGRTYLAIATRIKVLRDMGIRIEKK